MENDTRSGHGLAPPINSCCEAVVSCPLTPFVFFGVNPRVNICSVAEFRVSRPPDTHTLRYIVRLPSCNHNMVCFVRNACERNWGSMADKGPIQMVLPPFAASLAGGVSQLGRCTASSESVANWCIRGHSTASGALP